MPVSADPVDVETVPPSLKRDIWRRRPYDDGAHELAATDRHVLLRGSCLRWTWPCCWVGHPPVSCLVGFDDREWHEVWEAIQNWRMLQSRIPKLPEGPADFDLGKGSRRD